MNSMTLEKGLPFKRALILLVCVYLAGQAFFPNTQRRFFWGEGLCLVFLLLIFKAHYFSSEQKRIIQYLYLWILFAPLYGWWVTSTFWSEEYNPYYFWRSLVPFYYTIFFFFAYRWCAEILAFIGKFRSAVLICFLVLLFFKAGGIGGSVVLGLIWLGLQYKNENKRFFWFTYCLLLGAFLLRGQGGSIKMVALMLGLLPAVIVVIYRMNNAFRTRIFQRIIFRVFLIGLFVLIVIGAKFLLNDINQFMAAGQTQTTYSLQGVDEGTGELVDANAKWRLFIWAYVLGQFWKYPQGIGFGTPLLGNDLGVFFDWGEGDFEVMQLALGAHNSFLTLLGRLGVVALIFFFLIGRSLLQTIGKLLRLKRQLNHWDSEFRLVFGSLVVFLIAVVQASFNMMIETPLYAAHFWFPLGLFVRLSGDYIAKQREKIRVTA